MDSIFVISSDKISIKRFIQFTGKYLSGYEVGNMHYLMAYDSVDLYINDFYKKYPKRIISYFTGKIKTDNPITIVPDKIKENADLIIWFTLYSLKPEVILTKSDPHILKGAIMDWEKHIIKMQERSL